MPQTESHKDRQWHKSEDPNEQCAPFCGDIVSRMNWRYSEKKEQRREDSRRSEQDKNRTD